MEVFLGRLTQQAMNYAIRTGITITSGYAIKQCGRLLKTVEGHDKQELRALQLRLESKVRIISPAIDMIELIAARGNTSLESAVALTKSLRFEIQSIGTRFAKAAGEGELTSKGSLKSRSRAENDLEVKRIIADVKALLERIEDAVPLINLAITTSGVSLSTTLPATVSPSRLLQASTFLTAGDMQYCGSLPRTQQIGPVFTLSVYMLFSGHAYRPHDEEGIRETTWKEVMHKAKVKLLRVPLNNVYDYPTPFEGDSRCSAEAQQDHIPSENKMQEFAYQLLVVEDLDDDRVHTFEEDEPQPEPYEGVDMAGIREIIPIHEISKIFYADTGKILNIGTDGETNNPILLLKRDINAVPPRRMMDLSTVEHGYDSDDSLTAGRSEGQDDEDDTDAELEEQIRRESTPHVDAEPPAEESHHPHPWRLPPNLDLEWMAFEVYTEAVDSNSEYDGAEEDTSSPAVSSSTPGRSDPLSPGLAEGMSNLNLRPSTPPRLDPPKSSQVILSPRKSAAPAPTFVPQPGTLPAIKTSLSLLEMLIRLTALQQFQQSSHLSISDEFLTFFLSESSTVGAGGDSELRRRARREARMRVGFDPYDESPIKRHGEEYLEHELHDGNGYDDASPTGDGRFDYDGYPHGRASTVFSSRSRGSTPGRSSPFPGSSPVVRGLGRSSGDITSSASPLLRRATTQPPRPGGTKRPGFKTQPTAPPASNSPRATGQQGVRHNPRTPVTPVTPPSRR